MKSDDKAFWVKIYKEMLFYRRFEERVQIAYTKQKFSGFCHLHIGQEALCAGVQAALQDGDYVISGYRSHTQAIAKGIAPGAVFAELLGRKDGCSRGKGGSMHMFSAPKRFLGGHGIVGGQGPIATGVGFAIKYRGDKNLIVCYLGDAAMNQGQVLEGMNMAAAWDLPVIFLIENNRYGMGTAITRTTAIDKLSLRAGGFGMKGSEVDGMDVQAVHKHMTKLVASMRRKPAPHLLEAHTYRYKGHSVSDPATYRTKEELAEYQGRDPILRLGRELVSAGACSEDDLKAWDKEAKAQVKEAEAFADASPVPELETLWEDVWATA